jgi:hypothetical protein
MTAYYTYSQLPSISGGFVLHPQPEDMPCHGDTDPHNMEFISMGEVKLSHKNKNKAILCT